MIEEIVKLINDYWKFDNNQRHAHNWHDKQDLLELLRKNYATILSHPLPNEEDKLKSDTEFLNTQFPGKDGSQITNDTDEEELEFLMNRPVKEIVLENKDVWEWVAIFYGALKELVDLKSLKETLYKGNPDGKEYAERKPLAWNAAKQAVELWEKMDYGAKSPIDPSQPLTEEKGDVYKGFEQEFKELSLYLDDLSQCPKDAGHTWIAFTDKFSDFKKRILAALPLSPVDNQVEAVRFAEDRTPVLGEVWKSKEGGKFVVTKSRLNDMSGRYEEYEYVCAKAHEDGDFSYMCTFQWCRCSD